MACARDGFSNAQIHSLETNSGRGAGTRIDAPIRQPMYSTSLFSPVPKRLPWKSKGEMMLENGKSMPSVDAWLREAKADVSAADCGMYLTHNGVVRATPKAEVRGVETDGVAPGHKVGGMVFGFDAEKVQAAIEATRTMPGIGYVRMWLASGELTVGDDIMLVLIGGDIRPHVVDALQSLVGTIKNECVSEVEREA